MTVSQMPISKNKKSILARYGASDHIKWVILGGITLLFTVILYPNLIDTHYAYQPGDVAERDIKALKDFLIEDKEATQINRQQAIEKTLTVYDHDETLTSKITQRVDQTFAEVRKIYQEAAQPDLKTTEEAQAEAATDTGEKKRSTHDKILEMKEGFEKTLGIPISSGGYTILEKEAFSVKISDPIVRILGEILKNGVVSNKEILLKESDKGILLRDLGSKTERAVNKLRKLYGLDQSKIMVRVIGQPYLKEYNYVLRHLIVDFTQRLILPNITLNRSETEERKKKAALEIKPSFYKIKAGEMLLREGEIVTEVQSLKLKALQRQIKSEQVFASGIGSAIIIVCLLMISYVLHLKYQPKNISDHNKNLLFCALVLIVFLFIAKIASALPGSLTQNSPFAVSFSSIYYGVPIAAGAMIICIFAGIDLAFPFAVVLAVCTSVLFQKRMEFFIYFLLNGAMAAYWIQDCRERKVFIKAGLKLGCLNIILATAIDIYIEDFAGFKLLWDCAFAFMGGMFAGIVTAGIVPLVEVAFNYTTDIKLLELANLERPILRQLMIEAPGTYHHSVIVGSMVEAAAQEIGANPLLSKVGGYYHDIGKIKKPLYYIENQTDSYNRHDNLAPSMSKRILIAHVKEGVEIARQNKLGAAIIDTICQSHGTSIITYFFEKAKQISGENTVNDDDFRYPGPKPQTIEAGLVMLADVTEAASRTLTNPIPSRIQGMVQKLINNVFSDGQLDSCELTLKDLRKIGDSFNKILNAIHHHRIEYAESPAAQNGIEKNGSPYRQPAAETKNRSRTITTNGTGNLKRLKLS